MVLACFCWSLAIFEGKEVRGDSLATEEQLDGEENKSKHKQPKQKGEAGTAVGQHASGPCLASERRSVVDCVDGGHG